MPPMVQAACDAIALCQQEIRSINSPRARLEAKRAALKASITQAFADHSSLPASSPDQARLQEQIVDLVEQNYNLERQFQATLEEEERFYWQQRESVLDSFGSNMVMALGLDFLSGLDLVQQEIQKVVRHQRLESHRSRVQVHPRDRAESNHESTPPATASESVNSKHKRARPDDPGPPMFA